MPKSILTTVSLVVLSLVFSLSSLAQTPDKYKRLALKIDSLADIGLPKSALLEVEKFDKLARLEGNTSEQVRAVIYRMTFQSYLEEKALEAIINRLKLDIQKASYPVKPILQSLLADIYFKYYQQHRYQFFRRSRLEKRDSDFTRWDLQTLINEVSSLYRLSLSNAELAKTTPMLVLNGVLVGDTANRYLRPTLYDFLAHRALDFYLNEDPDLLKPKAPFKIQSAEWFADNATFIATPVVTSDTLSLAYQGIRLLKELTSLHLNSENVAPLADVNLKRLDYVFRKSVHPDKDSLYVQSLKKFFVTYATIPFGGDALVKIGHFYQQKDSLKTAAVYFRKAILSYPETLASQNARNLIEQLEAKELTITIENVNVPEKPVLVLVKYKNINQLRYRLYKLNEEQAKTMQKKDIQLASDSLLIFLKNQKVIKGNEIDLINPDDYKTHHSEFPLDPLKPGNYLLLTENARGDDRHTTNSVQFKVSNLIFSSRITPAGLLDIRTMNRETGEPLRNVKLIITEPKYEKGKRREITLATGLSNGKGEFLLPGIEINQKQISVRMSLPGDTCREENIFMYGAMDTKSIEKEIERTVLFTDRQIYRPGQTVYFKGIQLIEFKSKSRIVTNQKIKTNFKDANGKEIGSLTLETNEFGTFAGSFIIPQNTFNGYFNLNTLNGNIGIQVEEYKRPSFQVELDPIKESIKLSDSVTLKGRVTAFSGYGISNGKVAYRITRQKRVIRNYRYDSRNSLTEILSDTLITNSTGEFEIKFEAQAEEGVDAGNDIYNFMVIADVTDASGETRSTDVTITVANKAFLIEFPLPQKILANDELQKIPVNLINLNSQKLEGNLKVKVYLLEAPDKVYVNRLWSSPDKPAMSREQFKSLFPYYDYSGESNPIAWKRSTLIREADLKISASSENLFDLAALKKQKSGMYEIVLSAQDAKGDTASSRLFTSLIAEPSVLAKLDDWVVPVKTILNSGENAEFFVGLGSQSNVLMETYNGSELLSSEWLKSGSIQSRIKVPVKAGSTNFAVQFLTVFRNRVLSSYHKILFREMDDKLDIRFLTFRDKLEPGSKEQWKLEIKSSDNQAAEMMASLYDSSLDVVAGPQSWSDMLYRSYNYSPNYFVWNENRSVAAVFSRPFEYSHFNYSILHRNYEALDLLGYNYYGGYNQGYRDYLARIPQKKLALVQDEKLKQEYIKNAALVKSGFDVSGQVTDNSNFPLPGVSVSIMGSKIWTTSNSKGYFKIKVPRNTVLVFSFLGFFNDTLEVKKEGSHRIILRESGDVLNEVVINGLRPTRYKRDITGNIPGVAVEQSSAAPMADGQASADLQTSVVGRSVQPREVLIRKNFNETAFFYPQLRTNPKGEILVEFTIPEALTSWRFKGLAHTKGLQTGYIEKTVVTQKTLMLSANMPRFFREGDTIAIAARLANLDSKSSRGVVELQLFDALTMKPVDLLSNRAQSKQRFELEAATNKSVSFSLVIPKGLDAITYRLTAEAGNFSDGEENTIPILPNDMLVTETVPMMVRAGQTRSFSLEKLKNVSNSTLQSKTLTLEYTQNPVWYAVQSLPYLMEYPYDCSEHILSRYFANSLASSIVNRLPQIKRVFDQWKRSDSKQLLSNLDKNPELKSVLLEETPWLQEAANETEQKKRIALLFDLNKMSNELNADISKLEKMQREDGGFPWFAGSRYADRYITQYILGGFGQLSKLSATKPNTASKPIIAKALTYLDNELIKDYKRALAAEKKSKKKSTSLSPLTLHALYVRSYFPEHKQSLELKTAFTYFLPLISTNWKFGSVYEQALAGFILHRNNQKEMSKAVIRSLKERAQQSDELGMYWAKNQTGYYWYQSPAETQALLIELFSELGNEQASIDEMKIWLLRNKQTTNWRTTKATALACHALLLQGNNDLEQGGASSISLGGQQLAVLKPEVREDAGTGYIKTAWKDEEIEPGLAVVEVKNTGKAISWGALHWQYLEKLDKITSAETPLKLERKYFIQKQTDAGPVLTEIKATNHPKTGDVLKVVVYLTADREYEYVHLKDMRPSGTEPTDVLSGYRYQDRIFYYQTTRDVATNFFINYLPKGKYVFEYNLRVVQPGNYSTGISTIQCMYAPEFNAHSEGSRMVIK